MNTKTWLLLLGLVIKQVSLCRIQRTIPENVLNCFHLTTFAVTTLLADASHLELFSQNTKVPFCFCKNSVRFFHHSHTLTASMVDACYLCHCRAHGSDSSDGKLTTDFFHLYVPMKLF